MNFDISATNIIIAITAVISFVALSNRKLFYDWAMVPTAVKNRGEYYRFILSGFVHADLMHFAFNMITLYSFGRMIEYIFVTIFGEQWGMVAYVAFYLVAMIVSDIPTYLKNKNNESYLSIGASGAVSAIIFAAILFQPTSTLLLFFIPMPAFIFGVLYLGYTTYANNRQDPSAGGINHSAHLWGAIFGIVSMVLLVPEILPHFFGEIMNWRPF